MLTGGFENNNDGNLEFAKKYQKNKNELIINEVMSSNYSYLPQNSYNFYDWVELKNNSDKDINLSDYYITTSLNNTEMYQLEDKVLKPGEYYILMASGDENLSNNSYKHANFKISSTESLYLIKDNKDYLVSLLNIERNIERPRMDIGSYSDVKRQFWYMYDELFNKVDTPYKEVSYSYNVSFIKEYFANIYDENDTEEEWFNKVKDYASSKGFATNRKEYKENPEKFLGNIADFCSIIRVMLTTTNTSPNMYDLLKIYGKENLLNRVDRFLKEIS